MYTQSLMIERWRVQKGWVYWSNCSTLCKYAKTVT